MASYRKVNPRIWDDEVFDGLSAAEALIALWLITGRATNRAGIAIFTLGDAANAARIDTFDTVWDTVSSLCRKLRWPCERLARQKAIVILRTHFRYNPPMNADHLRGQLSDLHSVPHCRLLQDVYTSSVREYLDERWHQLFDTVLDTVGDTVGDTVAKMPKTSEATSTSTSTSEAENTLSGKPDRVLLPYSPLFEEFWAVYPPNRGGRKPGKKAAFSVWLREISAGDRALVIEAASAYAASEGPRGFVKHPQRFLAQEFWRDWLGAPETPPRALMRPQTIQAVRAFLTRHQHDGEPTP